MMYTHRIQAVRLSMVTLLIALCSFTPTAGAETAARFNRLEKATVRVFGCRSMSLERLEHEGQEVYLAVPEVGHGSGLMVSPDGLILTARHVVQDMSGLAVKLPLSRRALPAVIVYEDPHLDFAFIKVQGGFENYVELPASENVTTLATRDSLFSIGYPLDPSAETPTTQEGIVSRVTENGLLQTSAALNPGHSGGPVFTEVRGTSHLIGLAVARHRRGEGMGLIVPIQPATQALRNDVIPGNRIALALDQYQRDPELWAAMERYSIVVAEMNEAFYDRSNPAFWFSMPRSDAAGAPAFLRELESLAVDSMLPEAQLMVSGYLWNLFVASRDENALGACIQLVQHLRDNNPDVYGESHFAQSLMRVVEEFSHAAQGTGVYGGGYQACGVLGSACCGSRCGGGLRCMNAVCVEPQSCTDDESCTGDQFCSRGFCEAPQRLPLFRLNLIAGIAIDNHEDAQSTANGGGGGVMGQFQVLRLGNRNPWAFSLVLGGEFFMGGWRSNFEFSALADIGVRFLIGSRTVSAVISCFYNLGFMVAEGRPSGVYLGYRTQLGVQFGRFEIGLSWRETGRSAHSTYRSLELVFGMGLGRRP